MNINLHQKQAELRKFQDLIFVVLQEVIQDKNQQEVIFGDMHNENVSHPNYYNKNGRKECIVEMEEKYGAEMTAVFCLMNAYKYLYRAGDKDGNSAMQDNLKAKWYFDYANKLISSYGTLFWNNDRIEDSELYLDIREMLG